MIDPIRATLPELPLLLWDTPPALEMVLGQEGVPFARAGDSNPLALLGGRFVLFDGAKTSPRRLRARLSPDHVAIDVGRFRESEPVDPFGALVDTRSAPLAWEVGGRTLVERACRHNKSAIRRKLIHHLRRAVAKAGGVWARLAAYPYPYRSAFNFRADLDESYPEDYAAFARSRGPIDDCTTHFVSTHAYAGDRAALADLRRHDAQSHGHYHVVYRDPAANRRNLERAEGILAGAGIETIGFAAPHGRWNAGLDEAVEGLGYRFASDFQVGRDDLPFFPWRGDRFSNVLQIPVHPVSEGLFLDAGAACGRTIGGYLAGVVRAKIDAGEPAFVYGHPERRLGRYPEILAAVAAAVADEPLTWRVTLSAFAAWWRFRGGRRWSLLRRGDGHYEVQFEDWDATHPLGLEIDRGGHVARIPLLGPRTALRPRALIYQARPEPAAIAAPRPYRPAVGLRAAIRSVLDWETVTPVDELPGRSATDRLKRQLRRWRDRRPALATVDREGSR